MALSKKYVDEFEEISLEDSFEGYSMLVGKGQNTNKVPVSKIKDYIDNIVGDVETALAAL